MKWPRPHTWLCYLIGAKMLLWTCVAPATGAALVEEVSPRRSLRVLHLYSYRFSYANFPGLMEGLAQVLEPAGVLYDTEALDLKRHDTPEHRKRLYELFAYRMSHLPEDFYAGVITSDENALLFALEHQQTLFAELPIVFCGVNSWDLALAQNGNDRVTGVIEAVSIAENVALAKRLQPGLKTVYFIIENSVTGEGSYNQVRALGDTYQGVALRFLDLRELTWPQAADRLENLRTGEAAISLNMGRDVNGDSSFVAGGIKKILRSSPQPLYGTIEATVGTRHLGGYVLSHRMQAEEAARRMLRILAGTSPPEIPVLETSPNRYVFDYAELTRHGIPLSRLPRDAEVLQRPNSFVARHHRSILRGAVALVVVVVFLATIYFQRERQSRDHNAILTAEIGKRRETEKALLNYQARLKTLASELARAEERQRRHIAGLLHDEVGQSLAMVKMKIQCIQSEEVSETRVTEFNEVCETLTRLINVLRSLSFELSSPILKELGLGKTVEHFLRDYVQGEHGLDFEYVDDGQPKPLPEGDREMLFRTIRELLINTIKHAQASRVRVELKRQPSSLCMQVEDDGVGCDAERINDPAVRSGYGVFSIRERIEQKGGVLRFDCAPGRGCKVTIEMPTSWSTQRV